MVYIYPEDWTAENWGVGEQDINPYFECDDMIAPAIILLNKKGYRTTGCCSGHPYRETIVEPAYVVFDMDYEFLDLPTGWKRDREDNCICEDCDFMDHLSGFEGVQKIFNLNKALYDWAEQLPNLS